MKLFDLIPGWVYGMVTAGALAFAAWSHITLLNERVAQSNERLATAKAAFRSLETAQGETLRMQGALDDALHRAAERDQKARDDAQRLGRERDGLRDELAAARASLPSRSHQACIERANALDDVFGACVERYRDLAGKATGHLNDALKLDQAWPKSVTP